MKIIITAGGTSEKIDQVRKITNISTGHLGKLICEEFMKQQGNRIDKIFYICSKTALRPESNDKIEVMLIESVEDLENVISDLMSNTTIDIFVHSMAVSDYTVGSMTNASLLSEDIFRCIKEHKDASDEQLKECIKTTLEGNISSIDTSSKVSSSEKNLFIKLQQTKKIISLIKELQSQTFLVGFKLLEDVSKEHLFDVGFNQLRKVRCNLVMANDLKDIKNGNHIGMFIFPEKKYELFYGKQSIAENLVSIITKRCSTKHPQSKCIGSKSVGIEDKYLNEFHKVGKQLFEMGLLPTVETGTYGNMSVKDEGKIIITGRNIHKGNIEIKDIVEIEKVLDVDKKSVYAEVYYKGEIKPSIDTVIHHYIYTNTDYKAIIHIHTDRIYAGYPITDYNYPCGTKEEMDSILSMIKEYPNMSVIQMNKHGLLVMGTTLEECLQKIKDVILKEVYIEKIDLNKENSILHEWFKHYRNVYDKSHDIINSPGKYHIIYHNNGEELGLVYINIEKKNELEFVIYTSEKHHGRNLGIGNKTVGILYKLAKIYNKKYISVLTTEKCNVWKYYKDKLGFNIGVTNEPDIIKLFKEVE